MLLQRTYKNNFKYLFFIFIILISFYQVCNAQDLPATFESESIFGIEEPEEYKSNHRLPDNLRNIEGRPLITDPIHSYGTLHVVIESIEALNNRVISKKADRAEIWLGHLMLSRLDKEDVTVLDHRTSRIFDFPLITLKTGYYFISVRLYSNGVLWKNKKFHEEIYQVGIHEGKRTTLRRKLPHLHW